MLTPKQKAQLKGLANTLEPSLSVGKGAVDANLLQALANALKAHELVKVRILVSVAEEKETFALELAKGTEAELVQIIGHVIVLYKARKDKPSIILV
jgi:putative RNA-binding protein, YhbY family